MNGSPLKAVVRYGWYDPTGSKSTVWICQKEDYWKGGTRTEGKVRYIIVEPPYDECTCPDYEVLECGHERELKTSRGHKWFNRRRRCLLCALGVEPEHDPATLSVDSAR